MKYLVMECVSAYAVVLADDGRFLKVANLRYRVGQTVTDVVPLNLPERTEQPSNRRYWVSSLAAMAACLLLVVAMMFFRAPYASVYLTINPEVRIDVNRSDVVVGVEGVNDDGAMLLEGYDHRRKSLDTVMDELVDRAIAMGYLSDGGTVTLTLDADDEWVVSHSDSLSDHLTEYLTDSISVTIEITSSSQQVTIPVEPDYGDTDYGTEAPTQASPVTDDDSNYDDPDDGVTDYDAPEGDDVTDSGGDSGYDEDDNGDSGYDDGDD